MAMLFTSGVVVLREKSLLNPHHHRVEETRHLRKGVRDVGILAPGDI